MLKLRGGSGGISQLAFSRGLSSGGHLNKRSYVDLGNKDVQTAVMHYLDACFVNVVILQPKLQNDWTTFIFPFPSQLRLPYARTIFDGFIYENNQWVLGWTRYHHVPHWPKSRALA
eukprot:6280144-Pyramimonas_sp.AAC.1